MKQIDYTSIATRLCITRDNYINDLFFHISGCIVIDECCLFLFLRKGKQSNLDVKSADKGKQVQ